MKRYLMLGTAVAVLLSSCGKYVTHFTKPLDITDQDKVVVVCNDPNLKLAIENTLINCGMFVKNIETEYMFQQEMDEQINVEKYTYLQSLIEAIRRKGSVKGTGQIFDDIREWNNLKDELIRVDDYSKLILKKAEVMKKVYEVFGVDFIISVRSSSLFNYSARVISAKDSRLVFTLYMNSDVVGVEELLPSAGTIQRAKISLTSKSKLQNEQYYYIRFAQYLATKLIAGRG